MYLLLHVPMQLGWSHGMKALVCASWPGFCGATLPEIRDQKGVTVCKVWLVEPLLSLFAFPSSLCMRATHEEHGPRNEDQM